MMPGHPPTTLACIRLTVKPQCTDKKPQCAIFGNFGFLTIRRRCSLTWPNVDRFRPTIDQNGCKKHGTDHYGVHFVINPYHRSLVRKTQITGCFKIPLSFFLTNHVLGRLHASRSTHTRGHPKIVLVLTNSPLGVQQRR